MTKFEEDLNEKLNSEKVPMYITQNRCSMTRTTYIETSWIFDNYKNWHSDEEFKAEIKKLTDQLITRNDELISSNYEIESLKSQLISREKQVIELKEADKAQGKEIIQLKSQLQQQALPVVPEDVDKAIKYLKTQNNFATFADFGDILTEKGLKWLNDFQLKDRRFGFGGLNNKLFILSHLAITGYEVEKPKLFKLIFPNSTAVLQKSGELNSFADTVYKKYLIENAMTEQEIKSIDERYWQFAVPVEDEE